MHAQFAEGVHFSATCNKAVLSHCSKSKRIGNIKTIFRQSNDVIDCFVASGFFSSIHSLLGSFRCSHACHVLSILLLSMQFAR